jgi:hypothetical protein
VAPFTAFEMPKRNGKRPPQLSGAAWRRPKGFLQWLTQAATRNSTKE